VFERLEGAEKLMTCSNYDEGRKTALGGRGGKNREKRQAIFGQSSERGQGANAEIGWEVLTLLTSGYEFGTKRGGPMERRKESIPGGRAFHGSFPTLKQRKKTT